MNSTEIKSVSVVISALNEESNIKNLLLSILSQKEQGFCLKEIIVTSDGSSDSTVESIETIDNAKIKLIKGLERRGKASRLNTMFKEAKGDIIIIFDADVILTSKKIIIYLIREFNRSKNVGLVSGRARPKLGKTFIENSINVTYAAYDEFREKIKEGRNPYTCEGRILALSKMLARQIILPIRIVNEDNYLYFACLAKGMEYYYAKFACVQFNFPKTIKDHIKQNTRFISRGDKLKRIFGKITIKEYHIPKLLLYGIFLKHFLRKPPHSLFIFLLNLYCRYLAKVKKINITELWQVATTTKGKF